MRNKPTTYPALAAVPASAQRTICTPLSETLTKEDLPAHLTRLEQAQAHPHLAQAHPHLAQACPLPAHQAQAHPHQAPQVLDFPDRPSFPLPRKWRASTSHVHVALSRDLNEAVRLGLSAASPSISRAAHEALLDRLRCPVTGCAPRRSEARSKFTEASRWHEDAREVYHDVSSRVLPVEHVAWSLRLPPDLAALAWSYRSRRFLAALLDAAYECAEAAVGAGVPAMLSVHPLTWMRRDLHVHVLVAPMRLEGRVPVVSPIDLRLLGQKLEREWSARVRGLASKFLSGAEGAESASEGLVGAPTRVESGRVAEYASYMARRHTCRYDECRVEGDSVRLREHESGEWTTRTCREVCVALADQELDCPSLTKRGVYDRRRRVLEQAYGVLLRLSGGAVKSLIFESAAPVPEAVAPARRVSAPRRSARRSRAPRAVVWSVRTPDGLARRGEVLVRGSPVRGSPIRGSPESPPELARVRERGRRGRCPRLRGRRPLRVREAARGAAERRPRGSSFFSFRRIFFRAFDRASHR
ncbi:MAG: hypothetical protein GHCLOJNM_01589 [bacterium]|nr:hypothetical protein [bacterium]